ncbi:MAG: tandem-95 repeat protein [Pseudomonadota bacterium]
MRDEFQNTGEAPSFLFATEGELVVLVPDVDALLKGDYERVGPDLHITSPDGNAFVVIGYFSVPDTPTLLSPEGAVVLPGTAAALAGPRAPGQYAQADGQAGAERIGAVQSAEGVVTVERADGTTVALQVGDPVFQNDVVITGAQGAVGIVFLDETVFTMTANARFILNEMIYNPGGSDNSLVVDVLQGAFVFVTGEIAGSGGMTVETPVATLGIRGTTVSGRFEVVTSTLVVGIEPDPGTNIIGSYQIFRKGTDEVLATVSETDTVFSIQSITGDVFEFPKTVDFLAEEQVLTFFDQVYDNFLSDPVVSDPNQSDDTTDGDGDDDGTTDGDDSGDTDTDTDNGTNTQDDASLQDGANDPPTGAIQAVSATTSVQSNLGNTNQGAVGQGQNGNGDSGTTGLSALIGDAQAGTGGTTGTSTNTAQQNQQQPIPDPQPQTASFSTQTNEGQSTSVQTNSTGNLVIIDQPPAGQANITPTGTVTFDPGTDFESLGGGDTQTLTFTYGESDGTVLGTVEVEVVGADDPTIVSLPDLSNVSTVEDTPTTVSGFSASDPEGDPLTVSVVAGSTVTLNGFSLVNGAVVKSANLLALEAQFGGLSFATGDGFDDEEIEVTGPAPVIDFVFSNFIYTPSQDSNAGTLDFQVTIPGQAPQTSNATVTISPVADAPVALPDLNRVSTDEASPVTMNFTAFDPDPGDTLTYQILSQPTRGTVTPDGSGGFTFDPAGAFEDVGANQTVTVFFTYQATDQTGLTSQPATVSITVSGINDAPTAPATNTVAIDEDTASSAIAIGAADVEGDPLTFVLKTGFAPTKGTVAFDQVAGTFTYTPNANENGSDTFTIEVSDGQGGAPTEQVVSVTIDPVNDDPITVDDGRSGAGRVGHYDTSLGQGAAYLEPAILEVGLTPVTVFDLSPQELNSLDILHIVNPDNIGYGFEVVAQLPVLEQAVLDGLDIIFHDRAIGVVGIDEFGFDTISLVRSFQNDDQIEFVQDLGPVAIGPGGVLDDTSLDGGNSSSHGFAELATLPQGTEVILTRDNPSEVVTFTFGFGLGSVTYSSVPLDFYLQGTGSPDIDAAMSDYAENLIASFAPRNIAVTTDEDTASNAVAIGAIDIEGDPLTYSLKAGSLPTKGAVAFDQVAGTFTYTPNADENGFDTFTIEVSDGQGGVPAEQVVSVTINPVNDDPTAPPTNDIVTFENLPNFAAVEAADVDGDALTYSIKPGFEPDLGTVFFFGDQVEYFPDFNVFGADEFTILVSDGNGGTPAEQVVSVTIIEFNDPPFAPPTNTLSTDEDTVSNAVAVGATDFDGDPLTYSLKAGSLPSKGSVAFDQAAGTFTYTPNADENGSDTFTIEVSDGQGGVPTEQVVSVTINPVNDPIAVQSDFQIVGAGQTTTIDVLANDTDIDGTATLGLPSSTSARGATLSINPAGGIDYTPLPGDIGFDEFEYTLTDDDGTVLTTFATVGVEPTATVGQTITGTPNDDFLVGTLGDDTIFGLDGFDKLVGSRGNDQIDGGGSFTNDDNLAFAVYVAEVGGSLLNGSFVPTGVTVTWNSLLGATATDTYGDTDTLTNIVDIDGTFGADVFDASGVNAAAIAGEPNYFTFVIPYAGADTILGNTGFNIVSYTALVEDSFTFGSVSGINANLATGIIIDPWGDTDTVTSVEAVYGTQFVDTFTGVDGGFSRFRGLDGVDIYNGTATGIEELDFRRDGQNGGTGNIVVDLGAGTATDGFGNNETFSDVDDVRGGDFTNDTLTGSSGDNRIRGEGGNDAIDGDAGDDELEGGDGNDGIDGGAGADLLEGGSGNDNLFAGDEIAPSFNGNSDRLFGGEGNDMLLAGLFRFTLFTGDEGDDTIDGVGTFDQGYDAAVNYNLETGASGIQVTFLTPDEATVIDTHGDTDTLLNVNNIRGTDQDDIIEWADAVGSLAPFSDGFVFRPFGGNDIIDASLAFGAFHQIRYDFEADNGILNGITAFWNRDDAPLGFDPLGNQPAGFGVVADPSGGFDLFTGVSRIRGTIFNDDVTGDSGNNQFQSLTGNDVFNAGDGFDTLDLRAFGSAVQGAGFVVDLAAGTATNGVNSTVQFTSVESLRGSRLDDQIQGTIEGDFINGEAGDDVIDGFGGPNDGGIGGEGADTFVISANYGRADVNEALVIEDFTLGEDVIGLADGLSVSDLTVQQVGTETHITIVDNSGDGPVVLTLARLENVDAAALIAAQNDDDTAYDPAVIFTRSGNQPAVGNDDSGAGFQVDANLDFTTASVLANDVPSTNGTLLTVTGLDVSNTLGDVTDNGDGTFFYDPSGAFDGLTSSDVANDVFTYTFTDDFGSTGSATVTVTVFGVDDPIANDDDDLGFTTNAATAFDTDDVLANDTPSSNALSFSVISFDDSGTIGSVSDNGDGTFFYDPIGAFDDLDETESTTDSFTYTFEDDLGATATATVTITIDGVDDVPVIDLVSDQLLADDGDNDPDTFDEQTIELVDLFGDGSGIANFSDPDTADIPSIDISTISINGTTFAGFDDVILGIELVDGPDGPQLVFDNDENSGLKDGQIGRFTIEFQVTSDDNAGDGDPRVEAFLDITGDDDAPEVFSLTDGETQAGTEDTPFTLDIRETVGSVIQFNALRDRDSDTLTARIELTNPADGAFTLNTGDGTNLSVSQTGSVLEFSGPTADVERAFYSTTFTDDTIRFAPAVDVNGDVTASVTITDDTTQSDTEVLTISLTAVNDAPTSADGVVNVNEDGSVEIESFLIDYADVDGDLFQSITIESLPSNGTLKNGANAVAVGQIFTVADLDGGDLTYAPNPNISGTNADSFTYTVSDGAASSSPASTLQIDVIASNDLPTSSDNSTTINEDQIYQFGQSDFDFNDVEDGLDLTEVRIVSGPANGVLDDNGVTLNAGDTLDLDALLDGDLTYTPTANFNGSDDFTFRVIDSDGGESDPVNTFSFTINPLNDLPTSGDVARTINEDSSLALFDTDFTFNDVEDTNYDSIRIVAGPSNGRLEDVISTVYQAGDTIDRLDLQSLPVDYIPDPNFNGTDSFTFVIIDQDGGESVVPNTFTITVDAVNDDPTAPSPNSVTTDEDTASGAVSINATDTENDTLTYSLKAGFLPSLGVVAFDQLAGTFTYTPKADANGSDTFTILIDDGQGGTPAEQVVNVTINPVNDLPTSADSGAIIDEDDLYFFGVGDFAFSDVEDTGDFSSVRIISAPTNGTVTNLGTIIGDGDLIPFTDLSVSNVDYEPAQDFNGTDSFTFAIVDSSGGESVVPNTFTFTIDAVNDDPNAPTPNNVTTDEDTASGAVSINATDTENDTLTYSLKAGFLPSIGAVVFDQLAGTFTYTPNADANGFDTFTILIDDGQGGTPAEQVVNVTINPVNDPPVITDEDILSGTIDSSDVPVAGVVTQQIGFIKFSDDDGGVGDPTFSLSPRTGNPATPFTPTFSFNFTDGSTKSVDIFASINEADFNALGASDTFALGYDLTIDDNSAENNTVTLTTPFITLNVNGVDDEPFFTSVPGAETLNEDGAATIQGFAVNDVDSPTLIVSLSVLNGEIGYTDTTNLNVIDGDGTDGALSFSAAIADVNTALANGIAYFPDQDFNGTDTLTVELNDVAGAGDTTQTETVALNVTPVNDPPTTTDTTINAIEETVYTFDLSDFPFNDIDGDSPVKILLQSLPTNGTLFRGGAAVTTFGPSSTQYDAADFNGLFTYVGNADVSGAGADSFTFSISDSNVFSNTATVTIDITDTNDPPNVSAATDPAAIDDGDGNPAAANNATFLLADRFTASDPDVLDTPTIDETSVSVVVTSNPAGIAVTGGEFNLQGTTGNNTSLTVDKDNFSALDTGESVVFTVTFDVVSGPDRVTRSFDITVNGDDDAPAIAFVGINPQNLADQSTPANTPLSALDVGGVFFDADTGSVTTTLTDAGGDPVSWITEVDTDSFTFSPVGIDAAPGAPSAAGRIFDLFLTGSDGNSSINDPFVFTITPDIAGTAGDEDGSTLAALIGSNTESNYVAGFAGNDVLDGGSIAGVGGDGFADLLDGGEGSDTYKIFNDTIADIIDDTGGGGSDIDTIQLINLSGFSGQFFDFPNTFGAFSGIEVIDGTLSDSGRIRSDELASANFDFSNITLTNVAAITGRSFNDTIIGSAQNDTIEGNGGTDILKGGDGNDTIQGGAEIDDIDGGAGSDVILGSLGNDIIDGGADTDILNNSGLFSNSFNINFNTGVMLIRDSGGTTVATQTFSNIENASSNTLNDQFIAAPDAVNNSFIDGSNTDFDVLDYSAITSGGVKYVGDVTDDGVENAVITGINGAATDVGMDTLTRTESFIGTAQNDEFDGGYFDESVANTDGVDTLDGGDGIFDQLNFILGSSSIGVEINLSTGIVANDGFGNAETAVNFEDIITGDAGDTLTGDANANFLSSGAGSDVLRGNAGSDVLRGGSDSDTFVLTNTPGGSDVDTIEDFESGLDFLDISDLVVGATAGTIQNFIQVNPLGGIDVDINGAADSVVNLQTIATVTTTGGFAFDVIFDSAEAPVEILQQTS